MKICMVLEGCYPYVRGGVSSWMDGYIRAMPEYEFILWTIGADSSQKGMYKYELPENVVAIQETFLNDALEGSSEICRNYHFSSHEKEAIAELIFCNRPKWAVLFSLVRKRKINPTSFLMSETFLELLRQICIEKYPHEAFARFFHSMRSMLLTVLYLISTPVPKADIYHAVSTGYSGLLASLGKWRNRVPMILTEHGIYTREREEELLRATWTSSRMKEQWIAYFNMLAYQSYKKADYVTSLFQRASLTQQELHCDSEKCVVIPNGIHVDRMNKIPLKKPDGIVDIAAVVRLAAIKDIKTMLYAFHELRTRQENVRLHILGDTDDEEYAQECFDLVKQLQLKNVVFTGSVDIVKYLEGIDFTILTSISEGQPLSILESMAAKRPCVTTDVGCCRELIYGEADDFFGQAGIVVPPLQKKALADAMEQLVADSELRKMMGEVGQKRVEKYYSHADMITNYNRLYWKFA